LKILKNFRFDLLDNVSRLYVTLQIRFCTTIRLIPIQMARRHLPRGYSRELPRLANGPSSGLPRVYDIVLELISHVDAQIDAEPLSAFVAAYQTVSSLKLGELWAIPIMLRLGLIENLQRITTKLTIGRKDRDLADL
jgi:cyclic beta-1,2-glucan synthetase